MRRILPTGNSWWKIQRTSLLLSPQGETNLKPLRVTNLRSLPPTPPSLTGNGVGGLGSPGFTILEVLAVLLMVAAVCGLVLPELFRSRQSAEQKMVTRQIQTDLQQLVDEAKGTGRTAQIIFTPETPDYQVVSGEQTFERPLMGFVVSGEESVQIKVLANGDIQGGAELSLQDQEGRPLRVAIMPKENSDERR